MDAKASILQEIKRTAKENGGIPLGRLRFFSETGVKATDWGKHWARWSEAVSEAGLAPNQKVQAYDEKALLDKLTTLIRELGRFPVDSDLRLRARKADGFPTTKTFRRLGSKSQIAAKLIAHLKDLADYDDVVAACKTRTEADNSSKPLESSSTALGDGYVYLMRSGRNYKVGATNDIGRRGREIALQLPDPVNTIHVIRTDDPFGIEAYWKRRFATKLKNSEWFELDPIDVAAFKRRKFM